MPDETPAAPAPSEPPKTTPTPAPAPKAAAPKPAPRPAAKPGPVRPRSPKQPVAAPPAPAPRAPAPTRPKVAPGATVIDASGLVLGRAASLIAQRLLRGESIVVVNAEQSVVTGARPRVLSFYVANRARGSKRTGPHFPRYPDRIFRRTVRGMLPHLKTRGKIAFDRLEVFIGCPDGVPSGSKPDWLSAAAARPAIRPPMTLGEISRLLGARV